MTLMVHLIRQKRRTKQKVSSALLSKSQLMQHAAERIATASAFQKAVQTLLRLLLMNPILR